MTLEKLARIGRLQAHVATREDVVQLLTGAARSLRDAGQTTISNASRLTLAYTAIMEATQVALFANGYLPTRSEAGHHMTMVQNLVHGIGLAPERMRILDAIRHKRNAIDYSGEDADDAEVQQAVAEATALLADVRAWIAANRPELL